jgi:hypothetical protein
MAGDNNRAGARRDLLTHTAQALFRKRASHWMTEHAVFHIHSFWRIFSLWVGGSSGALQKVENLSHQEAQSKLPLLQKLTGESNRIRGRGGTGGSCTGGGGEIDRGSRHGGVREERGQEGERGSEGRGKGQADTKTSRIRSLPDIAMKYGSGKLRRYRTWSRCCLTSSTALSNLLCGCLTVSLWAPK